MLALLSMLLAQQFDGGNWVDHCGLAADPHIDGGTVVQCDRPIYAPRYAATEDQRAAGHTIHTWANGVTLTMPAFLVANSQNGMPSIGTMPGKVNEMYGFTEYGDAGVYQRSGFEMYCLAPDGDGWARNGNSCVGIGRGPSSNKVAWWATDGDYFAEADSITLITDHNEARVEARSAYGVNGTARLQLKGQVGTGEGPAVYPVAEKQIPANQPVFYMGNYYGSTGYYLMGDGTIRTGNLEQQYLPACTTALEGTEVYNLTQHCKSLCNGTAWKCLAVVAP